MWGYATCAAYNTVKQNMIPALFSKRLLYNVFVFVTAMSVCLFITTAFAVPPTLYSTTNYQSPVGGDPDDLMIIPGYGFAADDIIVYKALSNSTVVLTPPASVPTSNSATKGVAPIASARNVPDSLTIRLPTAMQKDQTYALWVRSKNGEWSNGIKINDVRPIWITPDYSYATAFSPAFASRYLKVVGRNLQPAPGAVTQVKLIGSATFTLTAANDNDPSTAIEHYVASVTLPASMPVGSYTVRVSRDGVSWVPLSGQTFTVKTDPVAPTVFNVSARWPSAPTGMRYATKMAAGKSSGKPLTRSTMTPTPPADAPITTMSCPARSAMILRSARGTELAIDVWLRHCLFSSPRRGETIHIMRTP